MGNERSIFWEIHDGLPRQAPGSVATTRHLLSLCKELPAAPDVVDIGCGPGSATLVLAAALTGARFTAVDLYQPFLDELGVAAASAGVHDRIRTVRSSMDDLPFDDEAFDLVWSEGAIYIMGFAAGLRTWRRLVRPGGYVVVTEATWFTTSPSAEAAARWGEWYPAMTDERTNEATARAEGYEVVATWRLPTSDWDDYYRPITARLDAYDTSDPAVAAAVAAERVEIELHRDYGDEYGYAAYVLRRPS